MTILAGRRRALQPWCMWAMSLAVVATLVASARAVDRAEVVKKLGFDPVEVAGPKWLPAPAAPVADAEAKAEAEMKPYTEVLPIDEIKFDLVPIKGGTFTMGSPTGEENRREDEGPQIEVSVDPFWMGKYEITWDEYETFAFNLDEQRRKAKSAPPTRFDDLGDGVARPTKPYTDMSFDMGKGTRPAICMTQYAAKMYCKWLSAKTGRYYRLPTEAEWEYACRAGTKTAYSFGDGAEKLKDFGWFADNSNDKYQKVGAKKPNAWGLYDMHGNVWEWVMDGYIPDFYKQAGGKALKNPCAVIVKEFPRCVRGGSWQDDPEDLRSAARKGSEKDWKMQDPQIPQSIWWLTDAQFLGFRVVRPLRVPTEAEAKLYEPDFKIMKDYQEAQGGKQ